MSAVIDFLKDVTSELKKVSWPSREETLKMTIIVIITTVVVGLYVGGIDFGLTKLLEQFLR